MRSLAIIGTLVATPALADPCALDFGVAAILVPQDWQVRTDYDARTAEMRADGLDCGFAIGSDIDGQPVTSVAAFRNRTFLANGKTLERLRAAHAPALVTYRFEDVEAPEVFIRVAEFTVKDTAGELIGYAYLDPGVAATTRCSFRPGDARAVSAAGAMARSVRRAVNTRECKP